MDIPFSGFMGLAAIPRPRPQMPSSQPMNQRKVRLARRRNPKLYRKQGQR